MAQHLSKDSVLLTLNFLCPVVAPSSNTRRSFTGESAVELFIKLYSLFTQPRPRLLVDEARGAYFASDVFRMVK